MSRGRLPHDAFAEYLSMGVGRSYRALAERHGVSKTAVLNRARAEKWQDKLLMAKESSNARAIEAFEEVQVRHIHDVAGLREAMISAVSPSDMTRLVSRIVKAAVEDGDMSAARLLLDRVFGRPRPEPLAAVAVDLPEELETSSDVRLAASAILSAVATGRLAPDDAQKASSVVDVARKSVEADDLAKRLEALEERALEAQAAKKMNWRG